MICGVNFRDEIMRMDRNHAPGPVVDLSAIAATFPGENITQAFKIFSYSFWKCHIFLGSLLCSLRFDFWGASTASWYQTEEGRVASGRCKVLLISFFQWNCAQEISQLKEEITDISTEIDAMDTEEGWESFTSLKIQLYWSTAFGCSCNWRSQTFAQGQAEKLGDG